MPKLYVKPESNLLLPVIALIVVLLSTVLIENSFPVYILREGIPAYLVALIVAGGLAGFGARLIKIIDGYKIDCKQIDVSHKQDADLLLGFVLGAGVSGLLVFLLGLLGLINLPVLVLLLVILWVFGFSEIVESLRGFNYRDYIDTDDFISLMLLILFAGFLVLLFAYSSLPPKNYDSMVYHLALPQQYLLTGTISEFPHQMMSYYPKLHEMLLLLPLALGGEIAANAFTAIEMLVLILMLAKLGLHFSGKRGFLVTASVVISIPLLNYLAIDVKNDTSMALFQVALISILFRDFNSSRKRMLLLGIIFGFSLSIKYTAVLFLPPLLVAMLICEWPISDWRKLFLDYLSFAVIAFFVAIPFYAYTFLKTGSPVYPFLSGIFGQQAGINYQLIAQEIQAVASLSDVSMLFYKLIFKPFEIDGDHAVLGALFFLSLPFVAFLKSVKQKKQILILLVFVGWYVLPLIFLTTKIRFYPCLFLLPALMLATALTLASHKNELWKIAATFTLLIGLIMNFSLQAQLAEIFFPGGYDTLIGKMSKQEYLSKNLPGYRAFVELEKHLKSSDKVVLVGERRFAYLNHQAIVASPYEESYMERATNKNLNALQFVKQLKADKVAAIYLGLFEIRRLKRKGYSKEYLDQLLSELNVVYQDEKGIVALVP